MEDNFIPGMLAGIILCFTAGVFVIEDDIQKYEIEQSIRVCKGIENLLTINTDGIDTFSCTNGKKYSFGSGDFTLFGFKRADKFDRLYSK